MWKQVFDNPIVQGCIIAVFTCLLGVFVGMITTTLNMFWDMKTAKRDLNNAFKKIRDLEETVYGIPHSHVGPSENCGGESEK